MSSVSREERAQAMRAAGFPEWAIPVGVAVSLAEFGGDLAVDPQSRSRYPNGDREESYGIWQIHLPAHPDVSRECAVDVACSTRAAFRISSGGTNWNPWSAFTNGSYNANLDGDTPAVGSATPEAPPSASTGAAQPTGWQCAQIAAFGGLPKGTLAAITGIPEDQLQAAAYACAKGVKDVKVPGEEQAAALGQIGGFFATLTQATSNGPGWYKLAFVALGAVAIVVGFRLYTKEEPAVEARVDSDEQQIEEDVK
jgi:hypothetical protein